MNLACINKKLLVAAIALAGLGAAGSSHALLQLAATVNGVNFCAKDNNVACGFGVQIPDTNVLIDQLALGSTSVPVILNGVSILGSAHSSASGEPDILDSTSLRVVNLNPFAVTIQVAVSQTNYSLANFAETSGSGTFSLSNGSTMLMEWYDDPTNGQGADTSTDRPGNMIDTSTHTANANLFSYAHNGGPFAVNDPGLFSMTEYFTFTLAACANPANPTLCPALISRGQTEIKSFVPEPATLALMGIALVGLGFSRRHKQA